MAAPSQQSMYMDIEYLGSAAEFVDDIFDNIEHIKLFEDFALDEVRVLCRYMTCYAAPSGYLLIEEGVMCDFLVLVLTGSISVLKVVTGHGLKQIANVGPGKALGELSLIDGRPRFATCITNMPTDFAVLKRESLNEILDHHPRLGNKFLLALLQIMTVRMRETSDSFLPIVYSIVP